MTLKWLDSGLLGCKQTLKCSWSLPSAEHSCADESSYKMKVVEKLPKGIVESKDCYTQQTLKHQLHSN